MTGSTKRTVLTGMTRDLGLAKLHELAARGRAGAG